MDNETYQIIVAGGIAAIGLIYNTYINYQRRRLVNNFCNKTVPELIEQTERINRDLTMRFQNLNDKFEESSR